MSTVEIYGYTFSLEFTIEAISFMTSLPLLTTLIVEFVILAKLGSKSCLSGSLSSIF